MRITMNRQSEVDASGEEVEDWALGPQNIEPIESLSVPQFADGLAYRLDTFPWVAEDEHNGVKPLTHKLVLGAKRDRVTFKWTTKSSSRYGLPRPAERMLVAVLVQLNAETGFRHRSLLFSFADIAVRLGKAPNAEGFNAIGLGLARLAGVKVFVDINAVALQQINLFGFEIGNFYPILKDGNDLLARFEWDENVFAVLAMSQGAKNAPQ